MKGIKHAHKQETARRQTRRLIAAINGKDRSKAKNRGSGKKAVQIKNISQHDALRIAARPGIFPPGLYWAVENGKYIGIDNRTGDAWVEEFETLQECIRWLRRTDNGTVDT